MRPLANIVASATGGLIMAKTFGTVARLQAGHGATRRTTSRRSFTRNAALGAVGIVTLQAAGGFAFWMWPNVTGAFGGDIEVTAENIPDVDGEPFRFADGQFFVVHSDEGVQALWWRCVHLGCTIPWVGGSERFICPCHGSVYAYNGSRESGPAERAMDAFPVTVNDNGSLTVNTNPDTVIERDDIVQPDEITPYNV